VYVNIVMILGGLEDTRSKSILHRGKMSVTPNRAHTAKSLIVLPHPSAIIYRLHTRRIRGPPKGLREQLERDTGCGGRGRSGEKGRRGDMYQVSATTPSHCVPVQSATPHPPTVYVWYMVDDGG
jgi:hypothetical protein